MKKFIPLLLVLPLTLLLSGCLGTLLSVFCDSSSDSEHCFQSVAIEESDPQECQKVTGKDFKYSNPPKDKCYLEIAENTGDPSVCDSIAGGFMSYTPEECLTSVFSKHTPDECAGLENEAACRASYAKHGKGCGDGFTWNAQAGSCDAVAAESSSSLPSSDEGVDSKTKQDLQTIGQAGAGKYMDLLTKAIENEKDPDKLRGLQAYKDFLQKTGEQFGSMQTTWDKLEQVKHIFLDSYDPSMSIDRMSVDTILQKGFFDRMKDKLFGTSDQTGVAQENAQAGDALTVYNAMLKRQKDNDYLQQSRLARLGDTLTSAAKDKAQSTLKDSAEEIAKGVAGDAFVAVGVVDHALSAFQEEAQKQMFLGLARAYDRRRAALAMQNPTLSPEEIHNRAVAQVKEDPYQDNTNNGAVKFGNILENGDCSTAQNPLCVDNRVWWTALDKTYQYEHRKQ